MTEAAGSFAPGAVWLQTGTVGVTGTTSLAELATAQGIAMLDAPVLGTKKPAEDGTLVVLASGDPTLRSVVEPVLDAVSSKVIWAGDQLGDASALKLACNAWVISILAATAQSLALAGALGLDPQLFLDAIDGGPVNSPYAQLKGRAMLSRAYEPSFTVGGVIKDLDLIMAAADSAGVGSDMLAAARNSLLAAQDGGHGNQDMAAIYEAIAPPT